MIHIESIEVVGNSYPSNIIKKGLKFNCSSVNLLVGNQGCGKSTMLKLLQQDHQDIKMKFAEHVLRDGIDHFYFDTEADNPRVKDPELFTKPSGQNVGIGYGGALASRFRSHGEVLQEFVIGPVSRAKDCIILLDEPESGLSITNQFRFISAVETAVKNGCQLFIATHCYPMIERFNVVSLEHRKTMSGTDFIKKVAQKWL